MRILVVFYSRDGHTRRAAKIIANLLKAELDEIVDKKSRKGILGFIKAGYDATLGKTTEIVFRKNPSEYDIVIIGTPVWNGCITPAIRTYMMKNKENIRKFAFFATCAIEAGKCLKQMYELFDSKSKSLLGRKVIHKGNIEKEAKEFAEGLIS